MTRWLRVALRVACAGVLVSAVHAPKVLVTPGPQQAVSTRNPLAGVHTRFIDEPDEWKIQRGLTMVREMGAPWIVEFFPWPYLEPAQGRFEWAQSERIITHARRQGLTVIARLGFTPEWARPRANADGTPTTVTHLERAQFADFARFAAEFAGHFAGQVRQIVIWNEPNLSSEWGLRPVTAEEYAELLAVSYAAIKRANPDAEVLAGALAPTLEPAGSPNGLDDLAYLEQLYAALSGRKPYDGWAVHSYGRTSPADEPPAADRLNFRRAELVRAIMEHHGDAGLPVYITEAGWNDDPQWAFSVSPAERIADTLLALDYAQRGWPWARCVAFWVFKLPAPARGYRDHFTFVTPGLEPLPIYDEVQSSLRGG